MIYIVFRELYGGRYVAGVFRKEKNAKKLADSLSKDSSSGVGKIETHNIAD